MKTVFNPRYRRLIQELIGARHDAGLTQVQAARALKWRRTMLSQVETCQRRADILEIHALAKLYGVKFQRLLGILDGEEQ